jgi:hypothetical protein
VTDPQRIIPIQPQEITAGQVWEPKQSLDYMPRWTNQIRILCRYPLEIEEPEWTAGGEFEGIAKTPVWIIEYINRAHKLERLPEKTLRDMWQLHEDIDPLDR